MTAQLLTNECNLIDQLLKGRDRSLFKLGKLCARGHDVLQGQSLRRINKGTCLQCEIFAESKRKKPEGAPRKPRKDRKSYYYQNTKKRVVCTKCGGNDIWVSGTLPALGKKKFKCGDCQKNFTVYLVEEGAKFYGSSPVKGRVTSPVKPQAEKKKEPVFVRLNSTQLEWAIIRELKKGQLTAKQIAKNINSPLLIVKSMIIELYNEEDSLLMFDPSTKKFTLAS